MRIKYSRLSTKYGQVSETLQGKEGTRKAATIGQATRKPNCEAPQPGPSLDEANGIEIPQITHTHSPAGTVIATDHIFHHVSWCATHLECEVCQPNSCFSQSTSGIL